MIYWLFQQKKPKWWQNYNEKVCTYIVIVLCVFFLCVWSECVGFVFYFYASFLAFGCRICSLNWKTKKYISLEFAMCMLHKSLWEYFSIQNVEMCTKQYNTMKMMLDPKSNQTWWWSLSIGMFYGWLSMLFAQKCLLCCFVMVKVNVFLSVTKGFVGGLHYNQVFPRYTFLTKPQYLIFYFCSLCEATSNPSL